MAPTSDNSLAAPPNAASSLTAAGAAPDRRSADIVMLAKPNQQSNLTRVNSTPSRSGSDDSSKHGTAINNVESSTTDPSASVEDPAAMLTVAPPKPGPADTLYPSPSGGFVPSPEEGQDWRLKTPPKKGEKSKSKLSLQTGPQLQADSAAPASSDTTDFTSKPVRPSPNSRTNSRSNVASPCRPPSLPSSQETASLIAGASSGSLSRRSSQASNSYNSPQLGPLTSSKRISALPTADSTAGSSSNPSRLSTCSSRRRQSGSSPSQKRDSAASVRTVRTEAPVKIRDFAFAPDDPKHLGISDPSPDAQMDPDYRAARADEEGDDAHEWDVEQDEDEDEFNGDEGDSAYLAEGTYRVMYQFVPESEHELAVEAEELVTVVGALDGGWAIAVKGEAPEVKGLVPATYLEFVSEA